MKYHWLALLLGLMFVPEAVHASDEGSEISRLVTFSDKTLGDVLTEAGLSNVHVRRVSRDSRGTILFVECSGPTNDTTSLAAISQSGVKINQIQGVSPILSDDGLVVCSAVDHALVFRSGGKIPLSPSTRYGFTAGGKYFFIYSPGKGATVFLTSEQERPLTNLEVDFVPQNMFQHGDQIFIFGHGSGLKSNGGAKGLVLSRLNGGYAVSTTIDLAWAGGVIDMDEYAGVLLVEGLRDVLPPWDLYNIETGKRTSLGVAKYYGFFLDSSLRPIFEK